jgi:hypothetical protein
LPYQKFISAKKSKKIIKCKQKKLWSLFPTWHRKQLELIRKVRSTEDVRFHRKGQILKLVFDIQTVNNTETNRWNEEVVTLDRNPLCNKVKSNKRDSYSS